MSVQVVVRSYTLYAKLCRSLRVIPVSYNQWAQSMAHPVTYDVNSIHPNNIVSYPRGES